MRKRMDHLRKRMEHLLDITTCFAEVIKKMKLKKRKKEMKGQGFVVL